MKKLSTIFLFIFLFASLSLFSTDVNTYLIAAIGKGNLNAVKYLLDRGADPNTATQTGITVLHFACLYGQYQIVELLIRSGANVNASQQENLTALHYAGMNTRQHEMIEQVINSGIVVKFGQNGQIAKLLIDNGANVNAKANTDLTPLMMAAGYNEYDLVVVLLKNGADANIRNAYNKTALDIARQFRYQRMVNLLQRYTR